MRLGALRVCGDLLHFCKILFPNSRIASFDHALIADALGLNVLNIDGAPLYLVASHPFRICPQVDHLCQFFRKVDRIVDAAVESETPERIVDVGGVTCQQHTPASELLGDALVNTVGAAVLERKCPPKRKQFLIKRSR